MTESLSAGSLAEIINGANVEQPVMQLLGLKKISTPTPDGNISERYRLLLSDGVHAFSFAMLATRLNFHITNGDLTKFALIRLDSYALTRPQEDKRVIVVLGLLILKSGAVVGSKIGKPVPIGILTNQDNQEGRKPLHSTDNVGNDEADVTVNKEPSISAPQSNSCKPFQEKLVVGRFPANKRVVHSIANLLPYANRWSIRARVTNKPPIRTWNNARGEGKLFSVDLLDESGQIRATGFNEQCDQFYERLVLNNVYYIGNGVLKPANKNFTSIKHDYEITFKKETSIEPCKDSVHEIPIYDFAFMPICELVKVNKNTIIDVIGVCKRYGDVQTIIVKKTNKELKKRDIYLVDNSNGEVTLTIWGDEAEKFDGSNNPVIAVKGVRVSDFGDCSLSTTSSSMFLLNPDTPETNLLRTWFTSGGYSCATNSISKVESGGFIANWKYLQQAKLDGLGTSDKADYFSVKAVIVFTKVENCMYMACPTADCNRKVIDHSNGFYRCEKCNKEFDNFKWRLLLSINISDCSDTMWVTCFHESAEAILETTAKELGEIKNSNPDEFSKAVQNANFRQFIFKLRAKMDTYEDESRLKVTAVRITPVNLLDYNKKLIEEIKGMI